MYKSTVHVRVLYCSVVCFRTIQNVTCTRTYFVSALTVITDSELTVKQEMNTRSTKNDHNMHFVITALTVITDSELTVKQ